MLEDYSGNITHNVTDVSLSNRELTITIENIVPPVITDDMAGWHILIELDNDIQFDNLNIKSTTTCIES